jgi:hypothetical protein
MNSFEQNTGLEETIQQIHSLYDKYQSNPYILSKIHHMICRQLPSQLENNIQLREQTILRNQMKTNTQDQFIRSFLNDCQYYYVSSSEKYIVYNGIHYQETDEDQVLYHILSSISQDRNPNLMSWKHKTKVSILKKIKDSHIHKSIPESETIQNVIDLLCPLFFSNKTETKYFLAILGDNIQRKKKDLIHFISPKMKLFLRDLNQSSVFYFNNQCTQTFKFKCHEKHYDYENKDCRLVKIQENIGTDSFWTKEVLSPMVLDILCVACHYSSRYTDSDTYLLQHSNEEDIISHVFRLRDTTVDNMIEQFIHEYLFIIRDDINVLSSPIVSPISSVSSSPQENFMMLLNEKREKEKEREREKNQISWKNMLFLWKQFLHKHHYPLNLYQPLIKAKLISSSFFQKQYHSDNDVFIGIGSSQLPIVQQFLVFWNETIFMDESFESEFEINEIANLFRSWIRASASVRRIPKKELGYLNESKIIDIILFFFPDIEFIQNKYLYHIHCSLWDKDHDIEVALSVKETIDSPIQDISTVSINNAFSNNNTYLFYCNYYSNISPEKRNIVSKSYFDKYLERNRR